MHALFSGYFFASIPLDIALSENRTFSTDIAERSLPGKSPQLVYNNGLCALTSNRELVSRTAKPRLSVPGVSLRTGLNLLCEVIDSSWNAYGKGVVMDYNT